MQRIQLTASSNEDSNNDIDTNAIFYGLKTNQAFLEAIEDEKELEIEFLSPTEGSLFIGQEVFNVKFSESEYTDIYKIDESARVGSYRGTIAGRYTITNFTKDILSKGKKDWIDQKRGITQMVEVKASPSRKRPRGNEVATQSSSEAISKSKDQVPLAVTTVDSNTRLYLESDVIKIVDCPAHATENDIRQFFSGLSVLSVFLYLHCHETTDLILTVYVKFETMEGAKLGLLRSNENLSYRLRKKLCEDPVRLILTDKVEAFFVQSLGLSVHTNEPISLLIRDLHVEGMNQSALSQNPAHFNQFYQSYCDYEFVELNPIKFIELIQTSLENDQGWTNYKLSSDKPWQENSTMLRTIPNPQSNIKSTLRSLWQISLTQDKLFQNNHSFQQLITNRLHVYVILDQLFSTLELQRVLLSPIALYPIH